MPIQGRTREQIRVAIGYNLGAIYVSTTSSAGGDTTSLIDNSLRGGDDDHNGKWIISTSGTNDGEITRVSDYVAATTDATVSPAFGATIPNAMTYEMWDEKYSPARIHDLINQAIIEATGRVFDPEESIALHSDGHTARYDIPTQFAMLTDVQVRDSILKRQLHACGTLFDETTNANITQANDTEDNREAASSLKLTIAAGAAANALITDSITSVNISKYNYLELWIKCSITVAAGDFHILLDNTAAAASPLETLAIPALVADAWTYVRIALTAMESNTAIISVGFRYTVDIGACTVWLDDIKVVDNESAVWESVPRHLWKVDKQARDLIFTAGGVSFMGTKLMKLRGGDNPLLLAADADVSEIDDAFIIARATALAMSAAIAPDSSPENPLGRQAGYWFMEAQRLARKFPALVNVRAVG